MIDTVDSEAAYCIVCKGGMFRTLPSHAELPSIYMHMMPNCFHYQNLKLLTVRRVKISVGDPEPQQWDLEIWGTEDPYDDIPFKL